MLMEHNIPVYEKFEAMLKEHGKVILITATGTGKSYVTAEYLERHNLKALVISPRIAICDNWKELTDRVEAITYNRFYTHSEEYYDGYDCYIFDESHHMAADKWGVVISKFLKHNKKPVIGLTAQSKRYIDNVDVADEFFEGKVVYGYGWSEAIKNNILPKAIYVNSMYNTDGLEEYYNNNNLTEELIGRLKYSINNFISIKTILRKHITEHRKAIIFVDTIDNIQNSISIIKDAFPNAKTFYIHSKLSDKEVNETLKSFKKAKEGFIFTVDMLNEGLHINGINTIIMLRKTGSPMIYLQQIGRALAPKNRDIIIFDFVANNISISNYNSRYSDIKYSTSRTGVKKGPNISDQFIIFDYNREIFEVLKEIDSILSLIRWTEEEDTIIREYYPKIGLDTVKYLPNRSRNAIRHRADRLGVYMESRTWTKEEEDILREYYPSMGTKIIDMLKGKTIQSIRVHAGRLKVKYISESRWTEEELDILKTHYPNLKGKIIEMLPGRSIKDISQKVNYLGLTASNVWTKEEDNIIKSKFPIIGYDVIEFLPGRSKNAVKRRAFILGISNNKRWTDKELNILRTHYPIIGNKVAEMLPGRNKASITSQANKLGISSISNSSWTKEEDEIIKANYPLIGNKVAEMLPGRSKNAVNSRAHKLNINSINNHNSTKWTDEELNILRTHYPIIGNKVAEMLPGRSTTAIYSKASSFNKKRGT